MFGVLKVVFVGTLCIGVVFLSGCESDAQKGAAVGTLAGAGAGAIIGHQSGNAGTGALIGGAVGAGGGYIVGNESDKRKTNQEIQSVRNDANTTIVNITNSNGSITPVIMRRSGNMWIGPKGEQYMSIPTPEQLKPVYGF